MALLYPLVGGGFKDLPPHNRVSVAKGQGTWPLITVVAVNVTPQHRVLRCLPSWRNTQTRC